MSATAIGLDQALLGRLVQLLSESPTYYPWQVIPPDGEAFDQLVVIGTPISGPGPGFSPGLETIVNTITCPLGYDGLVKRISNNFIGASFNPGLPSLIWRIRSGSAINNSRFVRNYDRIIIEFGTTNFPRETDGIFITSGQSLIYTVQNCDPGLGVAPTTQVACCFAGFFWPQQREQI